MIEYFQIKISLQLEIFYIIVKLFEKFRKPSWYLFKGKINKKIFLISLYINKLENIASNMYKIGHPEPSESIWKCIYYLNQIACLIYFDKGTTTNKCECLNFILYKNVDKWIKSPYKNELMKRLNNIQDNNDQKNSNLKRYASLILKEMSELKK